MTLSDVPFSPIMIFVFVTGYALIALEHVTKVNKTTIALITAVLLWGLQFENPALSKERNMDLLVGYLGDISQVIFFLIGALTIVEIISAHKGFNIISDLIQFRSKRKLFWIMGILAFFLSSVLDNLTTTIVMVTLLTHLVDEGKERWLIGAGVVIAANAGGAWTPIGDVTTTMLWIGGQISTTNIIVALFIPSVVCFIAAFLALTPSLKGDFPDKALHFKADKKEPYSACIFTLGITSLIMVPILKIVVGMPPFLGIFLGVSLMWLLTDLVHEAYEDRAHLRVPHVLTKIDMSGVLFFLGVLLSIEALEAAGILSNLAIFFDKTLKHTDLIAVIIGIASAIVDNVPLVAAAMSMYPLTEFPQDNRFWELIAYAAGTGGSMLIIGSAAGVVFMGLEKVPFGWYLKRITLPAMIGYFAGIAAYLLIG
ncbi:MAG: sodium:proton antiporter NhaD [Chlamydiia bacterium]|nr:sodium:proton antiporter NhaD [Chlamydiia bacterium]